MKSSIEMKLAVLAATCGVLLAGFCAAPAIAATGAGPGWMLTAHAQPTYLPPGGVGAIQVDVYNIGAAASSGPVTVTDTLPRGVTATEAGGVVESVGRVVPELGQGQWQCTGNAAGESPRVIEKFQPATIVTCHNAFAEFQGGGGTPTADITPGGPNANPQPRVAIAVAAASEEVTAAQAQAEPNRVTIVGGGAPVPASTHNPVPVTSATPPFGFQTWDGWFSNEDGTLDTQAGSHPYEATFAIDLNQALGNVNGKLGVQNAGGEPRDFEVRLPPGLLINPLAVAQCTREQLGASTCPKASQVGTIAVHFNEEVEIEFPIFNIVPPPGVPGEVGFNFEGVRTLLDGAVRSGGDYGITAHVRSIAQKKITWSLTTLWNVPAEASHAIWSNGALGGCTPEQLARDENNCQKEITPVSKPYLTLSTRCGTPSATVIRANTWQTNPATGVPSEAEASYQMRDSNGNPSQITGCEQLAFAPAISTSPDTSDSDSPAGLTVEVKPPVGGLEEPFGLGTSDIRDTTVALPPGFVINPGQAAGLQACTPAQAALENLPGGGENNGPAACPNASKVGTFSIKSPLIEQAAEKQFEGNVYILQSNPPNLKLLVAGSADGVNLKLVGNASLCETAGQEIDGKTCQAPGQLITRFTHTPELPFTDFKLSFSGGAQAALDTPAQCGTYESTADFTPWSSPLIPDFLTNASFGITAGPAGGPCPSSPMPFTPSMVAGSTTDQAGAFTNFSLLLQRGDGQQRIEKLQFKEPAGLAGLISSVSLCDEANANAGTCPAASHIGHAVVASGPGPYPLVLPQPGAPELPIYLTGPYKGAPFGLSIVTPVIAGPFNLGTIITRAKIEVDPRTAQITITTDPLPQIVDGVPTDLRSINSIIDRPGFLFNPTNCNPQEFTGTAWGTPPPGTAGPGATAPISSHFGVGSCRELGFHPKVAVSTGGKASRSLGASLSFKISYPKGAQGQEAWFKYAKFTIPKQLSARLTTLQKACLAKVFETERQNCPAASKIGTAVVHTQVLPVPLEGPVYFVSYGGAAFPDAVIVLKGDGVTIELDGHTLIEKGVTSATFESLPDVPFENIQVTLPEGQFSEFAANLPHEGHNFCGRKLTLPTELKASNGLELKQTTPVSITGCPKGKTRAQKLTAALKACTKKHGKKRVSCQTAARRAYGARTSQHPRKK